MNDALMFLHQRPESPSSRELLAPPPPRDYAALLMRRAPEARLWAAVAEQAVRDRDIDWIAAADETVGSFRWIAALLGIDPDGAQARVLRRLRRYDA